MTNRQIMLLAAGGSLALLVGAFLFQALGYAPCKLCLWQRWPHAFAIALGLVVLAWRPLPALAWAGALAMLASAGLGLYHTGVERGWWEGPSSCSATAIDGLSTEDLFNQIMTAPLIRCDEVAWQMFGLSMASWNLLASLAFAGLWVLAARAALRD